MRLLLFLIFSLYAYGSNKSLVCGQLENSSLASCQVIESQNNSQYSCIDSGADLKGISKLGNAFQDENAICSEEAYEKKFGATTKKEIRKVRKSLKKQCRKKAKEYKRALIKHLMKNKKYMKAFKVLMKRKKRRLVADSTDSDHTLKLDPEVEDAEQFIMSELEKAVPGLSKTVETLQSEDPRFQQGFHVNESVPFNIVMEEDYGGLCEFTATDLPSPKRPEAKDCKYCSGKDIRDSFVNDCSYMVSKDFPNDDAKKLLGIKNNTKDYCQKDMDEKEHQSDMSKVDELADELCGIAKDGKIPDFKIETSRNLYPDKTPDLAHKRGDFIQRYLHKQVSEKCKVENPPAWLSSFDEFTKKIQLGHPHYEGAKKAGDYGPDPLASTEQQQQKEIDNLKITLEKEKEKIDKQILEKDELIKTYKKENKLFEAELSKIRKTYKKQQDKLADIEDIQEAQNIYSSDEASSIKNLALNSEQLYAKLYENREKINILVEERKGLIARGRKYDDGGESSISKNVALLQKYYNEINSGEFDSAKRKDWDEKLFNQFKMVRITGSAKVETDSLKDEFNFSPKLDIAINLALSESQFTCYVDPHTTHKLKASAYLKGIALVGTGGITTALGLATGAVALIPTVLNSFFSLVCWKNCEGKTAAMRRYRAVGNLVTSDKDDYKRVWRGTKKIFTKMATLNGRLKIGFGTDIDWEEHDNFEQLAREYYPDKEATALECKEIRDKKNRIERIECRDEYGVVRKRISYSNGQPLKPKYYNKDGDRVDEAEFN